MAMANNPNATPFPKKFPIQPDKKPSLQPSPSTGSKILPLIRPKCSPRTRPTSPATIDGGPPSPFPQPENRSVRPQKFPAAGATPYVPVRHYRMPGHGMAPPVTIRTAVPVFSVPPLPPPAAQPPQADHGHQLPPLMGPPIRMASPVRVGPVVPVFAAPPPAPGNTPVIPVQVKESQAPASTTVIPVQVKGPPAPAGTPVIPVQVKEPPGPASTPAISVLAKEPPPVVAASPPAEPPVEKEENVDGSTAVKDLEESTVIESLKQLEI